MSQATVRVVLATANSHKVSEMRAVLATPGIELLGPGDLAPWEDVEETGHTLEENALLKARAVCAATGLHAIADDTGLFVEALGGKPGHHAARYAGPEATYADNVAKLLGALGDAAPEKRRAAFRTAMALVSPDGCEQVVRGAVHGRILRAPRGGEGFGYDPVFLIEPLGRTMAELSVAVKNVWSHRARAAVAAKRMLAGVRDTSSSV